MRKTLVLVVLAATVAASTAAPAGATVHPIVCSEKSSAPANTPAQTQDPPGITGQGQAQIAQPIVSILSNPTSADFAAFKPEGC